jgi:hypothetical protein
MRQGFRTVYDNSRKDAYMFVELEDGSLVREEDLPKICSETDCDKPVRSRGLCSTHVKRLERSAKFRQVRENEKDSLLACQLGISFSELRRKGVHAV